MLDDAATVLEFDGGELAHGDDWEEQVLLCDMRCLWSL